MLKRAKGKLNFEDWELIGQWSRPQPVERPGVFDWGLTPNPTCSVGNAIFGQDV